jgi:hypothetical protein
MILGFGLHERGFWQASNGCESSEWLEGAKPVQCEQGAFAHSPKGYGNNVSDLQ